MRPRSRVIFGAVVSLAVVGLFSTPSQANHAWNGYHWARTANPFTVRLGDNVSGSWDAALGSASTDWTKSTVLDTPITTGGTRPRSCKPTSGRDEVCNARYGSNGWLGLAQIWITGQHITQGIAKMNDTYFDSPPYNTSAWRNMVVCQEVGHTLGLDHQDENFDNPNLGTCMDYTRDPSTNQHPNSHDYQQLVSIYSHLDSFNTVGSAAAAKQSRRTSNDRADWGRLVERSRDGRTATYVRNLDGAAKLVTLVIWA